MARDLSANSKTMFEVSKKLSIAETVIRTIESAQSAYAWAAKWGGAPAGALAAGAALTAGYARVDQIRNQTFNGGGSLPNFSSPSAVGVTNPTPVVSQPAAVTRDVQSQAPTYQLIFNGDFTGASAPEIFEEFYDLINKNGLTLIERESENGLDIRAA